MSDIENASLEEIFLEYDVLTAQVEKVFGDVRGQFSHEVKCKKGCSDCCHALFDLSLVEAMVLHRAFRDVYGYGATRSFILDNASEADRKLTRLKHQYFNATKQGKVDETILQDAAKERVRCPLLGTDELCLLYDYRPLTCRIYGVPTAIEGKGHACNLCDFDKGGKYPTVHLDKIQDRLAVLSRKIAKVLGSRYTQLHNVYVPVSMALLNTYDDAYLGLKVQNTAPKKKMQSPLG